MAGVNQINLNESKVMDLSFKVFFLLSFGVSFGTILL